MNLVSIKEARALDLDRYFTGRPCKHGHIAERYTKTSACTECYKTRYKDSQKNAFLRYYAANKERHRDRVKSWSDRHPEKVAEMTLTNNNKKFFQIYGLTRLEFTELAEATGCWIDGCLEQDLSKLVPDHCHTSGEFRGVLCQKHNTGIGKLGDTMDDLIKAIEYLEISSGVT